MIDSIDERELISKVDHIFIMYLSAIMMKQPINIKHKVSNEVYMDLLSKIKPLNENNYTQMYDEMNVKETHIISKKEDEEKMIVEVSLIARYMDYIIDGNGKKISGNNSDRISKEYRLVLEKKLNAREAGKIKLCPNCGASIDTNKTGICEYCHEVYRTEDYDWLLTSIK